MEPGSSKSQLWQRILKALEQDPEAMARKRQFYESSQTMEAWKETLKPDPVSQLVVEQRRSNMLKLAIVFALLALSAPVWVPGLFTLYLVVYMWLY